MKTQHTKKELNLQQQKLIVENYGLVEKIVNSLKRRLPNHADLGELHSAGVCGLVDAALKLDPQKASSFKSYASLRIRGTIMDELRKIDYMPRSARQEAKKISSTKEELENKLGRTPSDYELRKELNMTPRQYEKVMRRTQNFSFVSLNDSTSKEGECHDLREIIADEKSLNAVEDIEKQEMYFLLKTKLMSLPEKQQKIIHSYYFDNKKLSEIAEDFQVSEARVCQIHTEALKTLRNKFKN